jgi:DNA replication licensing factor MCM7
LRSADVVEHPDIDEALRLMECSKESLQEDSDREHEPDKSPVSQVFRLIKGMLSGEKEHRPKRQTRQKRLGRGPGGERDMDVDDEEDDDDGGELSMVDIRARVLNAGWSEAVLVETISKVCFSFIDLLERAS